MGKGDKKSKKGKIFKSSFGKSRPNPKKLRKLKQQKTQSESSSKE
ncbi:MAG: hypothetical protein STSR0008_12770 [Ignavibacterium sp.]